MIIGTFLALILNFSTVGHAGAFALYWPMKLMDLPQFWKKDTFSMLHEGRSWGRGADGGVLKWRGGWGGRLLAYMGGGAGGAFQLLLKHFLTQKLRFFEMNVILIIKHWRPPPMPPPIMSLVKYENMKGDHEPQSKIMFIRSLVMFTSFHGRPYMRILAFLSFWSPCHGFEDFAEKPKIDNFWLYVQEIGQTSKNML